MILKVSSILLKNTNNYYAMLVEILGEENAGVNWATFLEYGTQNTIVIAFTELWTITALCRLPI